MARSQPCICTGPRLKSSICKTLHPPSIFRASMIVNCNFFHSERIQMEPMSIDPWEIRHIVILYVALGRNYAVPSRNRWNRHCEHIAFNRFVWSGLILLLAEGILYSLDYKHWVWAYSYRVHLAFWILLNGSNQSAEIKFARGTSSWST